MTTEEFVNLFHQAEVNLVALKEVYLCMNELKHMVEVAVAEEREACAKIADEWAVGWPHPSEVIAERIRARGQA